MIIVRAVIVISCDLRMVPFLVDRNTSINRRFNFGEISSKIRGFRRMGDLLISSVMSCFLYICEIL